MGGTKVTQAPAPQVPAPRETAREAIQAQIEALPEMLRAEREFGPEFSAEQLRQLQQFGPQFAQAALDIQREFGPQFAQVERELSPELGAAQERLASFLRDTGEGELAELTPGLQEDVRAAQSVRGIGDISPLGAIQESAEIQRLRSNLRARRINVALSTAGRVPIGGVPTVQGTIGRGQLVQNVSPENIFGAQSSINALRGSIFGSQADMFSRQPRGNVAGTIVGGLLGSATGGIGASIGSQAGSKIGGMIF